MRVFQHNGPPSRGAWRASLFALCALVGLSLLLWSAIGDVAANARLAGPNRWTDALLSPPCAVFFATFGVAAWLVWRRIDVAAARKRFALRLWGWQLLATALWATALFGAHADAIGALLLAVAGLLLAATLRAFWRLQPAAAVLTTPYLAWLCFAVAVHAVLWW